MMLIDPRSNRPRSPNEATERQKKALYDFNTVELGAAEAV